MTDLTPTFAVGTLCWIRRNDYTEHGQQLQSTVGKGMIMERGTKFCRVFGKVEGESYSFNEWFPIESRRLYLIAG